MQKFLLALCLIFSLAISGCSILESFVQESSETATPQSLSDDPPQLLASRADFVQEGDLFMSCWPDEMATLCIDNFMIDDDWFERGDFLTVTSDESIALTFVEGRPPDQVNIATYSSFPPSQPISTTEIIPESNEIQWQPTNLPSGDYIVIVFGLWQDSATDSQYDASYIIALRVN